MAKDKKSIRLDQKVKLRHYVGKERDNEETLLRDKLFQSNVWHDAKVVAVFLSTSIEIDTEQIIQQAWYEQKNVVVPKIMNKKLRFVMINESTDYVTGALNIKEPIGEDIVMAEQIDLIIVPGLAYSPSGDRLGYGAGFYDRYLANFKGNTLALSLV